MQSIKIVENILIFGEEGINKNAFHKRKQSIHTDKDIKRIVVSDKILYGKKSAFEYFSGYKSEFGIVPLYIKLPQVNGYVKYFDDNNKINVFYQ